mmetsp:Transcript_1281/g.1651  ORF Transcript_1281/g.1651 Transcript_1281/m.1651 type:complete len:204 (+) Transcript_1281:52-663(+)|eukprot:CAMPEP_0171462682 /NCGR_PEP_ID=MMETSP0945-20130129/6618_1 /TAXON_ID=109269 /ORGANISM="Vaucheria litorea, Strain CCMP2940" /LENGTH=203 /DNA_ID=CAMNT_0011989249 /DNA_START=51 /DNA_END=662 /DNA_ORIENTATION=+
MEWCEEGNLVHATPCESPKKNRLEEPEEGVWVFVPKDAPMDHFSNTRDDSLNAWTKSKRLVKGWFKSKFNEIVPRRKGREVGGVVNAACTMIAERPMVSLLAVGTGIGLAYTAANVLLHGGFIYCCFVPHFNFNTNYACHEPCGCSDRSEPKFCEDEKNCLGNGRESAKVESGVGSKYKGNDQREDEEEEGESIASAPSAVVW